MQITLILALVALGIAIITNMMCVWYVWYRPPAPVCHWDAVQRVVHQPLDLRVPVRAHRDRVLICGQIKGEENGIYQARSGVWRRTDDMPDHSRILEGATVFSEEGGITWTCRTLGPNRTVSTAHIIFTPLATVPVNGVPRTEDIVSGIVVQRDYNNGDKDGEQHDTIAQSPKEPAPRILNERLQSCINR
jgi:hypothetical protein